MKYATIVLTSLITSPLYASQDILRPLSADRPDATESPQTVDKGHFQLETSIVSFIENTENHERTVRWSYGESNLKYGISRSVDLQMVFQPYLVEKQGRQKENSGSSDIQLRSKINLWGNDDGRSAMALLPYLTIPSGSLGGDEYEGGLIITYADIWHQLNWGAQVEISRVYWESQNKHEWAGSHTLVVAQEWTPEVGSYLEYVGDWTPGQDYVPYGSLGMTWLVNSNLQLDMGGRFSLIEKGEDLNLFCGFTKRF